MEKMNTKMVALIAAVLVIAGAAWKFGINGMGDRNGAAHDGDRFAAHAAEPTPPATPAPSTPVKAADAPMNTSALHPPAGSRMALVVFEDLECPACAKTDPLLIQAQHNYGLALVRHDFLIPNHAWSKEAHIMARFFDMQSQQLGEEFRQYIFANQSSIYKTNLRQWADKFAGAHHTALPAFYDPTGKLRSAVEADTELGKATGVHQTPTIYVVTNSPQVPYEQVQDSAKLFETIEKVKSALPPTPVKSAKKK